MVKWLSGFTYKEILEFLRVRHRYVMSLSTFLREKLNGMTILTYLKLLESNFLEKRQTGYRRVHKAMNSKGYICRRDDVRHIFNPIVYGGSEGALKHGRGVGKSPPPPS